MAKRRRRSAARRGNGGGGTRSLSSTFNSLGRFAKPAKGVAFGALAGWLTRQQLFQSIPAIGGSRLVTLALAGAFLSDQKGMVGEVAGEVGIVAATALGFQYGQGVTVSGDASDDLAYRLEELEDRVAGELEDDVGDESFIGDEDDVGDDEVGDDEVGDVVDAVPA
jgi:hypothetical protein